MKYNIIYADPPWSFGSKMYSGGRGGFQRDISLTYSTMKTSDICAINVREITDDDCALFIWTTDAHIPDALKVIEAWGFKYKTVAFLSGAKLRRAEFKHATWGNGRQRIAKLFCLPRRGKCASI